MADSGTPPGATPPPSAPEPGDPQPSGDDGGGPTGTPSLMDDVIAGVVPEAAGTDRRRRNRRFAVGLGWPAATAVLALLVGSGWAWFTAEHDARVSSRADDKVDREGPAFSASVRPDTEYADATIFDSPFSAEDKAELLGMRAKDNPIPAFAEAHQGRPVFISDATVPSMQVASPRYGYAEAWLVDLLSDRKASLVINDLRVKGLTCTPARAVAAIEEKGQAGGSYEGMFFDLTGSTAVPRITGDEEEHYGEPYFTHKKIDLGNGAAPGGLRIQVFTGTKDCTWKAFEATYVDSTGQHTQDITDNGRPFHARGFAAQPEQVFQLRSWGPFVTECGTDTEVVRDC